MRTLVFCLGLIFTLAFFAAARGENELETVEAVDLERYVGRWYAVASIVRRFNRSCVWGNMAEYTLREDGKIEVLNTCYTKEGKRREVRARAWRPDPNEPGKLKVSFIPLFGYRLFPADYWILELGEDYGYAVVGHPSRNFGWILSREPEMETELLQGIARRLEAAGYDFSDFKLNPGRPPEEP